MLRASLALLLLVASQSTAAQYVSDVDYRVNVDVQLVQLPISVVDKHGLSVHGLQQEHFTVYEDKTEQTISLFKEEDIPLSVGLVIDASDSMVDKLDRVHTAALTFVQKSNPEDETGIFSFGDNAYLEQDFTRSQHELNRAFRRIAFKGNTALYDAVSLAAAYVRDYGRRDKKVLLVISDGQDNKSRLNLRQVLKEISESKVIVYTVGLLGPNPVDAMSVGDAGKSALKQLAEASGGAAFFPKSLNEVETVCAQIAQDLRDQYTIGYRPSNPSLDGSWRKVVVKIHPPKTAGSLKVRTKPGYYAPEPNAKAKQATIK